MYLVIFEDEFGRKQEAYYSLEYSYAGIRNELEYECGNVTILEIKVVPAWD